MHQLQRRHNTTLAAVRLGTTLLCAGCTTWCVPAKCSSTRACLLRGTRRGCTCMAAVAWSCCLPVLRLPGRGISGQTPCTHCRSQKAGRACRAHRAAARAPPRPARAPRPGAGAPGPRARARAGRPRARAAPRRRRRRRPRCAARRWRCARAPAARPPPRPTPSPAAAHRAPVAAQPALSPATLAAGLPRLRLGELRARAPALALAAAPRRSCAARRGARAPHEVARRDDLLRMSGKSTKGVSMASGSPETALTTW